VILACRHRNGENFGIHTLPMMHGDTCRKPCVHSINYSHAKKTHVDMLFSYLLNLKKKKSPFHIIETIFGTSYNICTTMMIRHGQKPIPKTQIIICGLFHLRKNRTLSLGMRLPIKSDKHVIWEMVWLWVFNHVAFSGA